MSQRPRKRRRPMAEINVVPYIDVMLVLLIIFMVTAPLLNLGVNVDLPDSSAESLPEAKEPIIVTVANNGDYFLNIDGENQQVDTKTLTTKVGAFSSENPDLTVLVGGDDQVEYGKVFQVMVLLQKAGVSSIGLMSDPHAPGQ
ncbi:MAG: protein TolR [bacterium]